MRRNISRSALDALVGDGLVDIIEAFNAKTSLQHLNAEAASYATEHGIAAGAGSDAHVPGALGAAYVEVDVDDVTSILDPAGLLDAITSGRVVGEHRDPPREWTARIVPSVTTT
jgi:predicted metal-dependent phosphoesterase TrpH